MSTRSQWSFLQGGKQVALVYKHTDGYPAGHHGGFAVWERFIAKVIADCKVKPQFGLTYGHRFDDPEYLASRFVYYLLRWEGEYENLNTGQIGISSELHSDIEYLYEINCDSVERVEMRCKSMATGKYVNREGKSASNSRKKIGGGVYVAPPISIFPAVPNWNPPFIPVVPIPAAKKKFANDTHTKLRRKKNGQFIPIPTVISFYYPRSNSPETGSPLRRVKIIDETPTYIRGIQLTEKTGFRCFKKSVINDWNTKDDIRRERMYV